MVDQISVGGIVTNDKKVVLVFQGKTKTWTLPKGRIKNGESFKETAFREIYEETGIKSLTFVRTLGSYIRGHTGNPNLKKRIIFFQFITSDGYLEPRDSDILNAKWVKVDEVESLLSYEKDRDFFLGVKDLIVNS
jgi:8-oxo-dGTP diphosphatase